MRQHYYKNWRFCLWRAESLENVINASWVSGNCNFKNMSIKGVIKMGNFCFEKLIRVYSNNITLSKILVFVDLVTSITLSYNLQIKD